MSALASSKSPVAGSLPSNMTPRNHRPPVGEVASNCSSPRSFAECECPAVDAVLFASYGIPERCEIVLRATAGLNCFWIVASTAAQLAPDGSRGCDWSAWAIGRALRAFTRALLRDGGAGPRRSRLSGSAREGAAVADDGAARRHLPQKDGGRRREPGQDWILSNQVASGVGLRLKIQAPTGVQARPQNLSHGGPLMGTRPNSRPSVRRPQLGRCFLVPANQTLGRFQDPSRPATEAARSRSNSMMTMRP